MSRSCRSRDVRHLVERITDLAASRAGFGVSPFEPQPRPRESMDDTREAVPQAGGQAGKESAKHKRNGRQHAEPGSQECAGQEAPGAEVDLVRGGAQARRTFRWNAWFSSSVSTGSS